MVDGLLFSHTSYSDVAHCLDGKSRSNGCDHNSVMFAQLMMAWQTFLQMAADHYGTGNVESVVSDLLKHGTQKSKSDHCEASEGRSEIPFRKNDGVELILHEGHDEVPLSLASFSDAE